MSKDTKSKTPREMTDAELTVEAARLAELRTAVRLAQNTVTAEQELRAVAGTLSGAAREAFIKTLGGSITPVGETGADT